MRHHLTVLAAVGLSVPILAESTPKVDTRDFNRLHAAIKPQPGESPWREIAWLTDVTEARKRSVAENKPILIFTAADGSPIGRT